MYIPIRRSQFKKDYKKAKKRSKNLDSIDFVLIELTKGNSLDAKYYDHALFGSYNNHRECHIEPDWLLIYFIDIEQNEIIFVRTGSHSDLFKK
jgi:mRNA interferase YafQ